MCLTTLLLVSCFTLQLYTACMITSAYRRYIRARRCVHNIIEKMQVDDLIDQMLDEPSEKGLDVVEETGPPPPPDDKRRERLASLVAGGQAKQYGLVGRGGKPLTAEQVDAASPAEVAKWYSRYEAKLGAQMTKTLGQALLGLYAKAAGVVLTIP